MLSDLTKKGEDVITTKMIRSKLNKTKYTDNASRNIIADCLILLKNYGLLRLISNKVPYKYIFECKKVDIDDFIRNFTNETDMRKILYGFKKYGF